MNKSFFYQLVSIGLLLVALTACKTEQVLTPYEMDLTPYRPSFEITRTESNENTNNPNQDNNATTSIDANKPQTYPNNSQAAILDVQLSRLADDNKKLSKTSGFRIQVYSGSSREEAAEHQKKAKQVLYNVSNTTPDIIAEMPKYRVRLGYFFTRIEAESVLSKLRKDFPNAIIVKDEIEISKILARYK